MTGGASSLFEFAPDNRIIKKTLTRLFLRLTAHSMPILLLLIQPRRCHQRKRSHIPVSSDATSNPAKALDHDWSPDIEWFPISVLKSQGPSSLLPIPGTGNRERRGSDTLRERSYRHGPTDLFSIGASSSATRFYLTKPVLLQGGSLLDSLEASNELTLPKPSKIVLIARVDSIPERGKGARTVEEPGEAGSFDGNGRLFPIREGPTEYVLPYSRHAMVLRGG
ncbi:hypothetical protein LIER_31619 [Lithospermum erythrorhizon]|uniref:Uncharacterized protein n=1 Tax=Lithospermum erythrorhizon TaxID=34254 RepID=A0AAV3RXG0_LITER